jgi:transcriptional regulator with XRE-family HTH domain/Zn-dependent peptidase ImmA (M78 family)
MIGTRLREIRLARGYTLEQLSARMDGRVTKQALSKYEKGKSEPRPSTLVVLATALGVKTAELLGEPEYEISCLQYRTRAPLAKRSEERVEATLRYGLERRVRLEDRMGVKRAPRIPEPRVPVCTAEDAEVTATRLRSDWSLGTGPIANVTETLERQAIHVFEVAGEDDFDGLVAAARDADGSLRAVGIAENPDTFADRQRFNLAHGLGHVVMEPVGDMDEEDAANRFAGAFLVPGELVFAEVGGRRSELSWDELLHLKRSWGASAQCILHRLRDLDVISQHQYDWWRREIDRSGFAKVEPAPLARERSMWTERNVARAQAEGLLSREQAAAYLGESPSARGADGIDRQALMKLSASDRRELLSAHAEKLVGYYEDAAAGEWLGADLDEP